MLAHIKFKPATQMNYLIYYYKKCRKVTENQVKRIKLTNKLDQLHLCDMVHYSIEYSFSNSFRFKTPTKVCRMHL